jgi:hypothetical protein
MIAQRDRLPLLTKAGPLDLHVASRVGRPVRNSTKDPGIHNIPGRLGRKRSKWPPYH